jgi:hypothetical protein
LGRSDFYFKVDWSDVWGLEDQSKPLLTFVCLPYKSYSPNFGKQNSLLEEFHRNMCADGTFIASTCTLPCVNRDGVGPVIRRVETKKYTIWVQTDDDGEKIVQPGEEECFLVVHAGDHLMVPFQCETCHFRNIYHRNPEGMSSDEKALDFIWDAKIDSFWE